jgi:tryptophanyl-tRNA synthetase
METKPKPRILSGMRPTGALHLGHLTGALDNWVRLQDSYDCFYSVVDYHALTTEYEDPSAIRANVIEVTLDWLAAGIDPAKSVVFIQSLVPEHAELHLLLSMTTPVSWLERVPTYKDVQANLANRDLATYGFLGYPLLQTADIIIYKANAVPVGEDQAPHIEISREIVRRFNNYYGEVFPEPQTLLTPVPRTPGTDGRKMSKSYNNSILLKDTEADIRSKLKTMVTDPARQRKSDKGDPAKCPVFDLHKAFSTQDTRDWATLGCTTATIGCIECKSKLADHVVARIEPMRQKREELSRRPDTVMDILKDGSARARKVAQATMEEVHRAMKIAY